MTATAAVPPPESAVTLPSHLDLEAAPEAALASPLSAVATQPAAMLPDAAASTGTTAAALPALTSAPPPAAIAVASSTATPAVGALGTMAPAAPASWPVLGALLLVVALILGLGKLVKRVQGARSGAAAALQLKGGVQVGAKERVVWMQAGETHLLLGVSPGRVQTLHVFDVAPDFAGRAALEAAHQQAQDHGETAAATTLTPASRDFADRLKHLLVQARARGLDSAARDSTPVTAAGPATAPSMGRAPAAAPVAEAAPRAASSKPTFSFRA